MKQNETLQSADVKRNEKMDEETRKKLQEIVDKESPKYCGDLPSRDVIDAFYRLEGGCLFADDVIYDISCDISTINKGYVKVKVVPCEERWQNLVKEYVEDVGYGEYCYFEEYSRFALYIPTISSDPRDIGSFCPSDVDVRVYKDIIKIRIQCEEISNGYHCFDETFTTLDREVFNEPIVTEDEEIYLRKVIDDLCIEKIGTPFSKMKLN